MTKDYTVGGTEDTGILPPDSRLPEAKSEPRKQAHTTDGLTAQELKAECKRLRSLAMTELEADVIEAAQDLADAVEGGKYGPMKTQIARAKYAVVDAISALAAENDGRWKRP